jgi:hypothetical protein
MPAIGPVETDPPAAIFVQEIMKVENMPVR